MGRDWNTFIKAVDRAPKEFAKAVIDHLDPPNYAKELLRNLEYLCGWPGCWTRRIDVCFKCNMGVCEEHSVMYLGPKTKLEWYVCIGCASSNKKVDILKEIAKEDEAFWLEDQEAEQSQLEAEGIEAARAEDEEREEELAERIREVEG